MKWTITRSLEVLMSYGGKSFLLLIPSVAATLIVAGLNQWPTALLWSCLILNVLAAVIVWKFDDVNREDFYKLIVVVAFVIAVIDFFVGVRLPAVYWTMGSETLGLVLLAEHVPVSDN